MSFKNPLSLSLATKGSTFSNTPTLHTLLAKGKSMAITSIFLNPTALATYHLLLVLVMQSVSRPTCLHLSSTLILNSPFSKRFPYKIHFNSLKLLFSSRQILTGAPTCKSLVLLLFFLIWVFRASDLDNFTSGYSLLELEKNIYNFDKGCECG